MSDQQPKQARGKRRPATSGERLPWQPFTQWPLHRALDFDVGGIP